MLEDMINCKEDEISKNKFIRNSLILSSKVAFDFSKTFLDGFLMQYNILTSIRRNNDERGPLYWSNCPEHSKEEKYDRQSDTKSHGSIIGIVLSSVGLNSYVLFNMMHSNLNPKYMLIPFVTNIASVGYEVIRENIKNRKYRKTFDNSSL